MPEGRHTWPGIRDPALVGQALTLSLARQPAPATEIRAEIRLQNHGAGHHLPTYATPAILVKTFLADQFGSAIESTLQIRAVQRALRLEENRELFDTRIPAAAPRFSTLPTRDRPPPTSCRWSSRSTRTTSTAPSSPTSPGPQGLDLVRPAHARLLDSPYILFAQSHPLE